MKKVILLLVIVFVMISCNKSNERKRATLVLQLSSLSYNVAIRKYMISHNTNCLSSKVLDSLENVSDKQCDSILTNIFRIR